MHGLKQDYQSIRNKSDRQGSKQGRPRRAALLYFLLEARFFDELFLEPFFEPFLELFFAPFFAGGTLPPASRASDSPIAIACFLLVTFLPERPLFNSPRFISCMAFSTFSPAFLPYLAISSPPGPICVFPISCN